jgi:hypothetical protein
MVHAYETVGYPLDIAATATALGVPSDMVIAGGSTLTRNGSPDIFYLNAGNQTVNASAGDDPVFNDFAYQSLHGTLTLRQVIAPCRQAAKRQESVRLCRRSTGASTPEIRPCVTPTSHA